MAGKLQNADFKTLSELTGSGGSASELLNDTKIYVTANSLNKQLSQAITDGDIGGSGSKNYFSGAVASGQATTGFNQYADAASASPVDGTGGSPSGNFSIAASGTSPLSGLSSLVVSKDAANRQGEGLSIDFTLDTSDKGKVLAFSMNYAISSGTYADSDISVWFYDVTNGALIQPAPYKLMNHTLGSDKFFCEIQTPYNCNTLRMILHCASTSTSAYSVKIDDLLFGPQAKLYGSVTTDWVSYTPTITGFGTVSGVNVFSRRVGSNLEVQGYFTSGTPTATTAQMTLGFGGANGNVVIDTAKVGYTIGSFGLGNASTTLFSGNILSVNGAVNYVTFGAQTSTVTANNPANGNLLAVNGGVVSFKFSVPIVGWSSSQLLSSDADTRVVAAAISSNSTTSVANSSSTKVAFQSVSVDTHGGWDLVNNRYVVKVAGKYSVSSLLVTTAATAFGANSLFSALLYKNGVQALQLGWVIGNGTYQFGVSGSGIVDAKSGDYFEIFCFQNSGASINLLNSLSHVDIQMIQGSAQIAASESLSSDYTTTAGQSINSGLGSPTIVDFDTKLYSSHASVTTGANWKFTANTSGEFEVSSAVQFAPSTATLVANLHLYKNGSGYRRLCHTFKSSASSDYTWLGGSTKLKLLAGEYIDIRVEQNSGTNYLLDTTSGANYISIARVGNY